jgi:hypothetical protein
MSVEQNTNTGNISKEDLRQKQHGFRAVAYTQGLTEPQTLLQLCHAIQYQHLFHLGNKRDISRVRYMTSFITTPMETYECSRHQCFISSFTDDDHLITYAILGSHHLTYSLFSCCCTNHSDPVQPLDGLQRGHAIPDVVKL